MKNIITSIIAVCLLASVIAVLGCTSAADPIVGKWGNDAYTTSGIPVSTNTIYITFDGNGTYAGTIEGMSGSLYTWKNDGAGKYEMGATSLGTINNVTLNGNVLSLSLDNKPARTFHKI
jgi:hypothetical protein